MNHTNLKCAINIFSVFLLLKVNKHKEKNEYWNQSTNHLKYNWSTRRFTNTLQIELRGSWCIRLLVIVVPKNICFINYCWMGLGRAPCLLIYCCLIVNSFFVSGYGWYLILALRCKLAIRSFFFNSREMGLLFMWYLSS